METVDVISLNATFWRDRRVLLTGHTGFKGSWASLWLSSLGAKVTGLALAPAARPNMFDLVRGDRDVDHLVGDLRDLDAVQHAIDRADPEIVLHLAAQPIVRVAAKERLATISTNTLGTVHILEALTKAPSVRVIVLVTTDKVYRNDDQGRPFIESDHLGGTDIYGGSKAAAEILGEAYRNAVFASRGVRVVTARGGNVIGGGDFGEDRLVPDVVRAAERGVQPAIRYPDATRPWQHVLDCLAGYLRYAEASWDDPQVPTSLNFGPSGEEIKVSTVASEMMRALGAEGAFVGGGANGPKEARLLAVDSSAARNYLNWLPTIDSELAIKMTADWYRQYWAGGDVRALTLGQIANHAARDVRLDVAR